MVDRLALVAAPVLLASGLAVGHGRQPAGAPDAGFGAAGQVLTDFGGGFAQVNGVVVQNDGRIVAVGSSDQSEADSTFLLARYRRDGALDPTFGAGGVVRTPFTGGASANAVAAERDDRMIVVGTVAPGDGTSEIALARYHRNGELDGAFGAGGTAVVGFGGTIHDAGAVAIERDGDVVVTGKALAPGASTFQCFVARFDRHGAPDAGFGEGGHVFTDLGGAFNQDCSAIALQRDGKIVVAGFNKVRSGVIMMAVARYERNGTLDATFGTGGLVFADFGGEASASAVAIQRDGKILAAGVAVPDRSGAAIDFGIIRYDTDGTPDASYGVGGQVLTAFAGPATANALHLDRCGRAVAVGLAGAGPSGQNVFALARYRGDGALDATFGTGGQVVTDFGGAGAIANAVAIQRDGRIIAAGSSLTADRLASDFALARYEDGDRCPDGDGDDD